MDEEMPIRNRVKSYLIIAGWTLAGVLVLSFVATRPSAGDRFNWPMTLGLALAVIYFVAVLWEFPKSQISSLNVPAQELKGRFELENEARRTVAQMVGGLAILITLYSTTETLRVSREQLELVRDGQLAERMTKAYSMFAEDKSRLGGIYTLESVAAESRKDHWAVVEVLTEYLREHAAWKLSKDRDDAYLSRPEIDAVVTVLRRRHADHEKNQLMEYQDSDALLAIPNWQTEAELQETIDIRETDLRGANLEFGYLKRAILSDTHFEGANLSDAHLERAYGPGAHFDKADLRGAHLEWAYLAYATFSKAQVQGADLRNTILLTQEQINSADGDQKTLLPAGIQRPIRWR